MINILFVGLGGGIGSICRYLLSEWANQHSWGKNFPIGIILVNLIGCLLIGGVAAFLQKDVMIDHYMTPHIRGLFIIGFLGGFTTFSSFSLDALTLFQRGEPGKAFLYVTLSIMISLMAVVAGFYAVEKFIK